MYLDRYHKVVSAVFFWPSLDVHSESFSIDFENSRIQMFMPIQRGDFNMKFLA